MTPELTTLRAHVTNARARLDRARARADATAYAARVAARVSENADTADRRARAAYAAAAVADSRAGDAVADALAAMRNTVRVRPLAEPLTPVYNRVVCRDCGYCFTCNDSEDCPDCGWSIK